MDVKTDIRIGEADAGAFAIFLVEEVGDCILYTIGDKAGIIEFLAINSGIDSKGRVHLHQLLPVKGFQLLIQVIGTAGTQLEERFQHTHSRAASKVCPIEHFLVTLEGNNAVSLIHVLGTQGAQLIGKNAFQPEEGFRHHVKSVCHHVQVLFSIECAKLLQKTDM